MLGDVSSMIKLIRLLIFENTFSFLLFPCPLHLSPPSVHLYIFAVYCVITIWKNCITVLFYMSVCHWVFSLNIQTKTYVLLHAKVNDFTNQEQKNSVSRNE